MRTSYLFAIPCATWCGDATRRVGNILKLGNLIITRQAAACQCFNEEAEFSQCGHQVLAMESKEFGCDLDCNAELSPGRVEHYMQLHRHEFANSEAQTIFCNLDVEARLPRWQVGRRLDNRLHQQLPLLLLLCMLLLPLLLLLRLLLLVLRLLLLLLLLLLLR